jgi:1-acylglycerone phosphate reductase
VSRVKGIWKILSRLRIASLLDNANSEINRWAGQVVQDLLKKTPPATIWRGTNAKMGRIGTFFPHRMLDGTMKKLTGLDVVEQMVRK